jgi:diguanylate cyclase (GGDEF)-like protein
LRVVDRRALREVLSSRLAHGIDDFIMRPVDGAELGIRSRNAVKRAGASFFSNPLTGLPGNTIIEKALNKKMSAGEVFVTGHIDIDNFKAFNDRYGYLKGDRVIMQTAYMLKVAVRTWGNRDDFVGHIGGDDFVLITTPERYNDICRNFICMFDTIIPFHYSAKDREKGYIEVKDRARKMRRVPLMSVTLALVLKNCPAEVNTLIELNDRIAEVKQYLKNIPGSKYMADRRITGKNEYLSLQVFSNDDESFSGYRPLGQILLEQGAVSPEQLDRALKEHWHRGVKLGEVLKDLDILREKDIEKALSLQTGNIREG